MLCLTVFKKINLQFGYGDHLPYQILKHQRYFIFSAQQLKKMLSSWLVKKLKTNYKTKFLTYSVTCCFFLLIL